MIRARQVKSGRAASEYFDKELARYLREGALSRPRGLGGGAHDLGIEGWEVGRDEVPHVLDGLYPDGLRTLSAQPLRPEIRVRKSDGKAYKARAGYELMISEPADVAVLKGVGTERERREAWAGTRVAYAAVVAEIERAYAIARGGHGGTAKMKVRVVVFAYEHATNRNQESNPHVHLLVAAWARCPDGKWRKLDPRPIYENQRELNAVYMRTLRRELERRLGLKTRDDGEQFQIVGITPEVREALTGSRRREILATATSASYAAREVASLKTRRPKPKNPPSLEELSAEWRATAERLGFSIAQVLGHAEPELKPGVRPIGGPRAAPPKVDGLLSARGERHQTNSQSARSEDKTPRHRRTQERSTASANAGQDHESHERRAKGSSHRREQQHEQEWRTGTSRDVRREELERMLRKFDGGTIYRTVIRRGAEPLSNEAVRRGMRSAELASLTPPDHGSMPQLRRLVQRPGALRRLNRGSRSQQLSVLAAAGQAWARKGYRVVAISETLGGFRKSTGITTFSAERLHELTTRPKSHWDTLRVMASVHPHRRAPRFRGLKRFLGYAEQLKRSPWMQFDSRTVLVLDRPEMVRDPRLGELLKKLNKARGTLVLVHSEHPVRHEHSRSQGPGPRSANPKHEAHRIRQRLG